MTTNRRLNALITIGGAVAGSLSQAVNSASTNVRRIGTAIETVERRQSALRDRMREFTAAGRDVGELQREYDRLGQSVDRLRGRLVAANSLQQQMAANRQRTAELRGQLGDAVAMAAALGAPVVVAAQFEQQIARVGAITRSTEEDLGRMATVARELGASTEWSASQAAEGMQYLAMSGFSVGEIVTTMPGLLSLATAGQIDLARASDISANVLRGFGLDASEMTRVGDVLTNTFTSSSTSLEFLGESMKYVAPVARATNVSLEETAAAIGLLGNAGIKGSEAGTALRSVLARLSAPSDESAEMLEQLGIVTQDAEGNLRPFADILVDMHAALQDLGTAGQQDALRAVFGIESLSAANVLIEQAGTGALQRYTETLHETGTAAEVAARQADTTRGAWLEFTGAIEEGAITIGNALNPTLVGMLGILTGMARTIGELANRFPLVTQGITVVVASLIGMRVAAIAGAYAWSVMQGVMLTWSTVSLIVSNNLRLLAVGVRMLGVAMVTTPIGAVIAAIAIGALLIWHYWEPIKAHFIQLWQDITVYARWAWEGIQVAWGHAVTFFSGVWEGIKTVFTVGAAVVWQLIQWSPLGIFVAEWSPLKGFFDWLWDAIIGRAQRALDWIGEKVGAVASVFQSIGWMNDDLAAPRVDAQGNPIAEGAPVVGSTVAAAPAPGDAFTAPTTAEAPKFGAMPDFEALAAGGGGELPAGLGGTSTNNVTINVTQQPGQDTRSLAQEVARLVRQQLEQEQGGALFDAAAG